MQVLREHYNNLFNALNGLGSIRDKIRAIEPIACYNPTIPKHKDNAYIDTIDSLIFFDCKVDTEGNTWYYFSKPNVTAIYYISCLFDKAESTVDKVIFKLTKDYFQTEQ